MLMPSFFLSLLFFLLFCVAPDVIQRTVTLVTLSEEHVIVSILPPLHLSLPLSHKHIQSCVFLQTVNLCPGRKEPRKQMLTLTNSDLKGVTAYFHERSKHSDYICQYNLNFFFTLSPILSNPNPKQWHFAIWFKLLSIQIDTIVFIYCTHCICCLIARGLRSLIFI